MKKWAAVWQGIDQNGDRVRVVVRLRTSGTVDWTLERHEERGWTELTYRDPMVLPMICRELAITNGGTIPEWARAQQ